MKNVKAAPVTGRLFETLTYIILAVLFLHAA